MSSIPDPKELATRLQEAAKAYYLGNPTMSDEDYDQQLKELQLLTGTSGAIVAETVTEGFQHHKHETPMLSLEKATIPEELLSFAETTHTTGGYVVQPKFDGLSLACIYENGVLVRAVTRGDGREGDVVTAQALRVIGIPRTIPLKTHIEVRGEVVVPWFAFHTVNQLRLERGEKPFANPRNLAAGTMRSLDAELASSRGLTFLPYNLIEKHELRLGSELNSQNALRGLGFDPSLANVYDNITSLIQHLPSLQKQREQGLSWATDGIVIKVNSLDEQRRLGTGTSAPKWAIAFKFPPVRLTTRVLGITVQVGRHGTLTPVAELAPVALDGSYVARATLHNFASVQRLDVRVGDLVCIQKAGDIIPEVVSVDFTARPPTAEPVTTPSVCPSCGAPTGRDKEDAVALRCTQPDTCTGTLQRRFEHAVSKSALDLDGFGPVQVLQWLTFRGKEQASIADLFSGIFEEMCVRAGTPGCYMTSSKVGAKLHEQVQLARKQPPDRLLYALSIPDVGRTASRVIMSAFGSIPHMLDIIQDTTEIVGVGPVVLASLKAWCQVPANRELLAALQRGGAKMQVDEVVQDSQLLAGQSWVITGSLSRSREEFQAIIERNGGKVASAVSKKTSFLLAGDATGKKKLESAKKHNIPVVTELEFWQKLNPESKA